ncbi:hypothetical protein RUM44_003147 [Polyplax serrata]|uniref:NudC domain-containing protein 1 n=1 Tax=Polyplax serrata TaxID=468196 RepID=A0ABR1AXP0_POLSC
MDKGSKTFDLRPDPLLLDDSFEGYKLSLEPIPMYRKTISTGVHALRPDDDHFSFSHVKMFSLHNHLHVNIHRSNNVYFVDENYKVVKVTFLPLHHQIILEEVCQLKNFINKQKGNYNISLAFPSAETVLIGNGSGVVYLVEIKDVQGKEVWQMAHAGCLFKENNACLILDCHKELADDICLLHVIVSQIVEKEERLIKDTRSGLFQTILTWRTFEKDECQLWKEKSLRKLCVDGTVDYIALEPGCKSLHMVCDKAPKWIYDSEENIFETKTVDLPKPEKLYSWMQTEKDITFWLNLPKCTKSDLKIIIEDLKMEIKFKGNQLISGEFYQRVDSNLSVWCFEANKLEIQLVKNETGAMWQTLLMNDDRGNEVMDPGVTAAVHEKLAHLCTDKTEDSLPPFNIQQLEDCDTTCETTCLLRLDSVKHKITHEVSLSTHQWLFKIHIEPTQTAALCFRYDIDACVWQFKGHMEDGNIWAHQHIGTFSAFGYVQASKTQKKFLTCPPNLSYVVICEASHHVYIYRQPSTLTSELKNRHTGKRVKTISKQQLVNLETNEQILGVFATDNILYLLLENSLCTLIINA